MKQDDIAQSDWHAVLKPLWLKMRAIEDETCLHPHKRITRRVLDNGQVRYMAQCPDCGKTSRKSLKQRVGDAMDTPPLPYADGLYEQTLAHRHARLGPAASAFYKAYDEYLSSPAWRQKRALCLATTSGACLHCGATAQTAHHVTYARIGNEQSEDLVPLCEPCHREIHGAQKSEIFPEVFL